MQRRCSKTGKDSQSELKSKFQYSRTIAGCGTIQATPEVPLRLAAKCNIEVATRFSKKAYRFDPVGHWQVNGSNNVKVRNIDRKDWETQTQRLGHRNEEEINIL